MHLSASGFHGSWVLSPGKLSNVWFKNLLLKTYQPYSVPGSGEKLWKAQGEDLFMFSSDMLLKIDSELLAVSQEYASDNELFLDDFAVAWTKLVTRDLFDGPAGTTCGSRRPRHRTEAPALVV